MIKMRQFLSELAALKFTPWYRWHPQLALRYMPMVEEIRKEEGRRKKEKGGQQSILEIGSGGLGIAPYLKQPVTGVDLKFEMPVHPLLIPIIGDAVNLRFDDDSFDMTVSMDMLEHLPKVKRDKAITEMLRVTKNEMIIGVPCGGEAEKHDQKMREIYASKNRDSFGFMDEHQKFGLPEEADIISCIKESASKLNKNVRIRVEGNMNIRVREFLMKGWISNNLMVNILFRKILLLFIPIFRMLERPPYYRKVFFVKV